MIKLASRFRDLISSLGGLQTSFNCTASIKPCGRTDNVTFDLVLPPAFRNLLPISHVCIEDGEKPMVLLPFMPWGNLKLFLRQCKLAEANNPQVRV